MWADPQSSRHSAISGICAAGGALGACIPIVAIALAASASIRLSIPALLKLDHFLGRDIRGIVGEGQFPAAGERFQDGGEIGAAAKAERRSARDGS
jgi:hypothetical protein